MKLLAALDETPRAVWVLEGALQLAERLDAAVVPFRAVQVPPEFPPSAATHHRDELPDFLLEQARRDLKRLCEATGAAKRRQRVADPVVRQGQPWRSIVAVADAIEADLVVLGSHGYRGADRVLGTTARRVADFARHHVMVLHDHSTPPRSVRAVLIGLSGSLRDAVVLAKGLEVAHALGASIRLIRVVEAVHRLPVPERVIVADVDLSDAGPATDELRAAAARDPSIVSRRVVISAARAWRAILEAARADHVDLVVVGSHGHRARDSLLRTTAGHMADEAREDVLIVHDGLPGTAESRPDVLPG